MQCLLMLSTLLLSGIAAAAPFSVDGLGPLDRLDRLTAWENRVARRLRGESRSGLPLALNYTSLGSKIAMGHSRDVQYDSNWAGAVQIDTSITQVTGTVTFPNVSIPPGGSSNIEYGGSAWVGIDGDTCQSSILQTGIDWYIQNGQTHYEAWYEWLPDYSYTFDIAVKPGDQISMKVVADSTTSGTAYISNLSTNKSVQHSFTGESALCQQNAEWIVEDFETVDSSGHGQLIPFSQWSPVTFTNASYLHGGQTSGVQGATIMDIQQNGQVLTDCATSGNDGVQCTYTG